MAFKTVFDPDFKYRSADATDVRLTFARIRRELQKAEREKAPERTACEATTDWIFDKRSASSNDRT